MTGEREREGGREKEREREREREREIKTDRQTDRQSMLIFVRDGYACVHASILAEGRR